MLGVALLAAAGCASDSRSTVQVYLHTAPTATASEVTVRLTDRAGLRTLSGSDFAAPGDGAPRSVPLATADGGELAVDVVIGRTGADTVAVGAVRLPLAPNLRYGVDLTVGAPNPLGACIGCGGGRAFPLTGSLAGSADSLFIVWASTAPGAVT